MQVMFNANRFGRLLKTASRGKAISSTIRTRMEDGKACKSSS